MDTNHENCFYFMLFPLGRKYRTYDNIPHSKLSIAIHNYSLYSKVKQALVFSLWNRVSLT